MSESNRVPIVSGLFAETASGPRLLGSQCAACNTPYFPKSLVCHNPECNGSRMADAEFGPKGKVWSYVVQHYPPPAPVKYDAPFAPFAIGVVDLAEGLRVIGRMDVDDVAKVKVGMDVELIIGRLCGDKDGNDVTTWKFRPV